MADQVEPGAARDRYVTRPRGQATGSEPRRARPISLDGTPCVEGSPGLDQGSSSRAEAERPLRARPAQEESPPLADEAEEEVFVPLLETEPAPRSKSAWGPSALAARLSRSPWHRGHLHRNMVTVTGFALLAYTWARVAGIGDVAFQLPYLVSGGLTGVGLVLVGLIVVSIGSRRREAAERCSPDGTPGRLISEATAGTFRRVERPEITSDGLDERPGARLQR